MFFTIRWPASFPFLLGPIVVAAIAVVIVTRVSVALVVTSVCRVDVMSRLIRRVVLRVAILKTECREHLLFDSLLLAHANSIVMSSSLPITVYVALLIVFVPAPRDPAVARFVPILAPIPFTVIRHQEGCGMGSRSQKKGVDK